MKTPASVSRPSARDRLLRAAAAVFARDGLTGATTRSIAAEAGVNEVTLFRQFRSKEKLLHAVVEANFGAEAVRTAVAIPTETGDLVRDLMAYALVYEQRLRENLPLIRAMIGEIHHHGPQEREVFRAIFRPLRQALIERLETARAAGAVRSGADPRILSDLFTSMIFTGVLRRAAADAHPEYPATDYRRTAVELLAHGAGVR